MSPILFSILLFFYPNQGVRNYEGFYLLSFGQGLGNQFGKIRPNQFEFDHSLPTKCLVSDCV